MIRSGDSCFENRIAAAWWIPWPSHHRRVLPAALSSVLSNKTHNSVPTRRVAQIVWLVSAPPVQVGGINVNSPRGIENAHRAIGECLGV
jgi:hypothetical protein